jgi:hypothetical protein
VVSYLFSTLEHLKSGNDIPSLGRIELPAEEHGFLIFNISTDCSVCSIGQEAIATIHKGVVGKKIDWKSFDAIVRKQSSQLAFEEA